MQIEHEFEELGIPLGGGWTFGSLAGKATIGFDRSGDWWIEDIWVDITKLVGGQWSRHAYMLDRSKPLERRWYHDLRSIIETGDKSLIDDKVSEALAEQRSYAGVDAAIDLHRGK